MTDLHAELDAWLANGAVGDPPREIAVHASVCELCTAKLGAFDALALIHVEAAGKPPPATRARLRPWTGQARAAAAVAGTVIVGLLVGFGVAQLLGSGPPAGRPEGAELAGFAYGSGAGPTQTNEQTGADAIPGVAQTPTGVATPQAGVTPGPLPSYPPGATALPTTPPPSATTGPTATPTATPAPTPEPTPTPAPECSDGLDNDADGWTDYPDDPACVSPSDNDEAPVDFHECNDSLDNDLDGFTDVADPGCGGNPFDDSEAPVDLHQCNDLLDNDGDTYIDFPADPQCSGPFDDDESQ